MQYLKEWFGRRSFKFKESWGGQEVSNFDLDEIAEVNLKRLCLRRPSKWQMYSISRTVGGLKNFKKLQEEKRLDILFWLRGRNG